MTDAISRDFDTRKLFNTHSEQIDNPFPLATTSKILCDTHNSMLGSISDIVGVKLFNYINDTINGSAAPVLLINGNDLELFMLQRMCAYYYSGVFTKDKISIKNYEINNLLLYDAIEFGKYTDGAGLYITAPPKHQLDDSTFAFETTPMITNVGRIIGIRFTIGTLSLALVLEPQDFYVFPLSYNRPKGFRLFKDGVQKYEILLSWEDGSKSGYADFYEIDRPYSEKKINGLDGS
ncbi:hypothetical protein [Xanthobacter flavus]|uniref:hypothetical protein n=1 Tax=Xanthobacter flavus TaxID=281 RepID=UPI00372A9510